MTPYLTRDGAQVSPALPKGLRIYAIGDIHGQLEQLEELTFMIDAELDLWPAERVIEIYVGDYIDRGPHSRGVIDFLLKAPPGRERRCIKGNHEAMLLNFLHDVQTYYFWAEDGGLETLLSYGIEVPRGVLSNDREEIARALNKLMPDAHKNFLKSLPISASFGDYFFVHAGVRPGVLLDEQSVNDCLWIRQGFLDSEEDWGKIIVHGHTPSRDVVFANNRIGIDTGAVFGGPLSCLVLEGNEQRILQAGGLQ